MNDRKQIFKYVFVTSIIMFLFAVIAPFAIKSLGIDYSPEYETVTYKVKEVYEEKNQSIYMVLGEHTMLLQKMELSLK